MRKVDNKKIRETVNHLKNYARMKEEFGVVDEKVAYEISSFNYGSTKPFIIQK